MNLFVYGYNFMKMHWKLFFSGNRNLNIKINLSQLDLRLIVYKMNFILLYTHIQIYLSSFLKPLYTVEGTLFGF